MLSGGLPGGVVEGTSGLAVRKSYSGDCTSAKLTLSHRFGQLLLDLCERSGRESVATFPNLYQTLYLWLVVRRSILDSVIDQRGQKFSDSVYTRSERALRYCTARQIL